MFGCFLLVLLLNISSHLCLKQYETDQKGHHRNFESYNKDYPLNFRLLRQTTKYNHSGFGKCNKGQPSKASAYHLPNSSKRALMSESPPKHGDSPTPRPRLRGALYKLCSEYESALAVAITSTEAATVPVRNLGAADHERYM